MFLRSVFLLFFLVSCSTDKYSIDSYKNAKKEIEKNYNLNRGDLVLTYDLAKVDDTNCIYSHVFGLVANEKEYAQKYLQKFKSKYKSEAQLNKEAKKKIAQISKLLIKLQDKYQVMSSQNRDLVFNVNNTDVRLQLSKLDKIISHLPLMLPIYKPCISSNYGTRKHPISKQYKFHCGVDFTAKHKAPIYSSANGVVMFAGLRTGYGNMVDVDNGNGVITRYAHLSRTFLRKGHKVLRGEVIGLQGKTGNATGEHLHFEVRIKGVHVNPYDFIADSYTCASGG